MVFRQVYTIYIYRIPILGLKIKTETLFKNKIKLNVLRSHFYLIENIIKFSYKFKIQTKNIENFSVYFQHSKFKLTIDTTI